MTTDRQETHYPFQFRGKGSEYYKIWMVNILLSIVTLYIYSAWAKVRTKRYFYGNTVLDNSAFEYHATPMQILKGRIVAVIILILVAVASVVSNLLYGVVLVLLTIITPWIIWRSLRFNQLMTSYRNVRFNFVGKGISIYRIFLIQFLPLIVGFALAGVFYYLGNLDVRATTLLIGCSVVAFYLFMPLIQKMMTNYVVNHSRYGLNTFSSSLKAGRFYLIYVLSILVFLLLLAVLLAAMFAIAYFTGVVDIELFSAANPEEELAVALRDSPILFWLLGIGGIFAYFLPFTLIYAYVKTRIRNYTFNNATLPEHVRLSSTLKVRSYWWLLFTNLLLLIFTLGLAYPWTKVRTARLLANNSALFSTKPLDHFVSEQLSQSSSLGDELGEAFDLDVDLGF